MSSRLEILPELTNLLLDFTVSVLVNKPPDLVEYSAEYFAKLLEDRGGGGGHEERKKKKSSQTPSMDSNHVTTEEEDEGDLSEYSVIFFNQTKLHTFSRRFRDRIDLITVT